MNLTNARHAEDARDLLMEFDREFLGTRIGDDDRDGCPEAELLALRGTLRRVLFNTGTAPPLYYLDPVGYLQSLSGWTARVIDTHFETLCDHDVGICACALTEIRQRLRDWDRGHADLGEHGWVCHVDNETGRLVGERMA